MAKKIFSDIERFMKFVSVSETGCWEWLGAINIWGYGQFTIGSRTDKSKKLVRAHRWSFEHFKHHLGELHIDHICKNRKCVNPEHLDAVTQQENSRRARKEKCKRGHVIADNAYLLKSGSIICKVCKNATGYVNQYKKYGKTITVDEVLIRLGRKVG